jgi:hypothetical protein
MTIRFHLQRSLYASTCLSCLDMAHWTGSSSNLEHQWDTAIFWLPAGTTGKRHALTAEWREHKTACGRAFPTKQAPWPVMGVAA